MSERLQKVLAMAGLGSRRKMEAHIEKGEVKVNGKVAQLGQTVSEQDKLTFQGKKVRNPLNIKQKVRVVLYHKPVGEICTQHCPEGRKTVFESLARFRRGRWIMVGRLDLNTSGLLLFTNSGELANRLMHPSYEVERQYAVRVAGEVTPSVISKLTKGVDLEDGPAKFDSVIDGGGQGLNHWYHVTLKEGRNREVRRLWESQNCTVSRLIRVRYAHVELPKYIGRGKHMELDAEQVEALCTRVDMPISEQ